MNISVIGGDLRQLTLARLLKKDGFDVRVIGFDKEPQSTCSQPADFCKSEIIILPVPITRDGKIINAPYSKAPIYMEPSLFDGARLVLGGGINESEKKIFETAGVKYIDYIKRDELMIRNAIPTAEGAIELAMSELAITIHSSRCLVVGFGRIGKVLGESLKRLGANVAVSARKCSDLAWISALGNTAIPNSSIKEAISDFDVIFNTVPAMVLDREILSLANPDTLIIDLASKPGGVDFSTAKELGLKVIWALGLPGKCAPITSGEIIKDTVINILNETEV